MSMSDKLVGPVESSFQESHGDLTRNNNRCADDSLDGDANANQIQSRDGRTLEEVGTESSFVSHGEEQDKIIIWGTDSQYDDPELAEFEMLECQELEAYLVESDESYGKDRRAPSGTLSSNLSQSEVEIPKDPSKNDASQPDTKEQENVSHRLLSRHAETCIARAEVSSDNDVFVSCYSTMSSLGGSLASAQTAESWPTQTGPYRTLSEDLTVASQSCLTVSDRSKGSLHNDSTHTDLNLNTTVLPEEPLLEAQDKQPAQNVVTYKETSGHLSNGINECNPGIANAAKEHNEVRPASESNVEHHGDPVKEQQAINKEECKHTDAKVITVQHKSCQPFESEDMQSLSMTKSPHDASYERKHKASQSEEAPEINSRCSKPSSKGTLSQGVMVDPKLHKKQASFERTRSASPSSLERRKPWCNSSNPAAPPSPKNTGSPRRQLPSSPAKAVVARVSNQEPPGSPQRGTSGLKPPSKSYLSTGIPKPIPPQPPAKTESPQKSSPKPKNVRPKIITYVRKSPQAKPHSADGPYETSTLPSRLTAYTSSPAAKEQKVGGPKGSPVLSSSNILYDKYRQELQKAGYYSPPGLAVSGIRPPSHTVPHKLVGKSESFHGELPDRYTHEVGRSVQLSGHEVASVYHSPRALKPQLGLGAVTRQPTTRTRMMMPGQRSASPLSHAAPPGQPAYCNPDTTAGDVKKPLLEVAPKSLLPKPGQSGLRPPGFSHLPTARLAAFGFVRSASVSSVSSNQSNESTHSDPCRSTSPARKEFQRDGEVPHPVSSPKRFAVVSPKPQFPVRQKSCVGRLGGRVDGADAERERLLVQSLRERCEEQARQITSLQDKLRKTSLCMDILSITTQHFCRKSENAEVKERELSLELARIRDEVVVSVGRWERLQGEKAELERSFEQELRELKEKQQKEQQALQERLREEQQKEKELLQKQQSSQLQQLRSQHHQQVEEMSESHERAMLEMEVAHNATLATLQEEHARTIKNLRMAHEQQKKSLEEEFEKLRLSLQDQVDTLTFQNRSLRDRAKRFEEALRRSTDEQIVDALAPYQHIEEDLKSLKQVLEMKNQQIHQQELKISELEKLAQKNVLLEERVQVLQQQNEDLKARIDLNLAASRQLSEENANLQEYVEKESNEKKRLSRTNEELLWRLQTGELSPRMSPNQSPLHRPSSGPASPSHPPFPR
ncbi:microtubule-associated tumor suppressor candidate 2 isoform X2 [Salminus brasiliensis]|uniref:microtubule-associated tumor suppressor candidate 2 isoform X2 n=1 Tax=Salminus brasiliensis TaxID=930266 RepID=UPI003B82FB0B